MSYYIAKVNFETGETNRKGDPVMHTGEFLIPAESVLEVEKKLGEYLSGTSGFFETIQIKKSKIEAVID
jgi:hypothetical protein